MRRRPDLTTLEDDTGSMAMDGKTFLILTPQTEGGYTVTSSLFPELVTEGDSVSEALANAEDALAAVIELYQDQDRQLPSNHCAP